MRRPVPLRSDGATCESRERLGELEAALRAETGVVRDLREALIQQRSGVASGEAQAVEASADSIGRILLTLEQARRRRIAILESLTGGPAQPLERLERVLGVELPPSLQAARLDLRGAAEAVRHEVAINHHVLRGAVEAGEAFLQALFSAAADPAPVYRPVDKPDDYGRGTGVIVNRTA